MIIHTSKIARTINNYLINKGWGHEKRFFDKVISAIEIDGDNFGFWAFLNSKSTNTSNLRIILDNYKHLSINYNTYTSLELSHFNNVDGIDSALASLG